MVTGPNKLRRRDSVQEPRGRPARVRAASIRRPARSDRPDSSPCSPAREWRAESRGGGRRSDSALTALCLFLSLLSLPWPFSSQLCCASPLCEPRCAVNRRCSLAKLYPTPCAPKVAGLQQARLPCPSLYPGLCSSSWPLNR